MIMAAAAAIGLGTEKRLKEPLHQTASMKNNNNNNISASKKPPSLVSNRNGRNCPPSSQTSLKEHHNHVDTASNLLVGSEDTSDPPDYLVDGILLLKKSMLEKQWNISKQERHVILSKQERAAAIPSPTQVVISSGTSARHRRIDSKNKFSIFSNNNKTSKQWRSVISPELLRNSLKGGYVRGGVLSDKLLTHVQVVRLSQRIKDGLLLEDRKSRLKERLGCEPSDEQLATSLRISRANVQSKLIECSLAREKLAMSNICLVMSIAKRYDNMGAEMADLIQGGLIGLLRGIEKFDSSKGFKISTYLYWWIRQGVSRALVENSRTLRLPRHLHERLSLIRNAKATLEEKAVSPSIDKIAECLNMSQKKVRNATEAITKVFSLDREAFPTLNGLPGESPHSYIADNHIENNPWHGVDEWAVKDEIDKLISLTLGERERDIIRL